MSDFWKGYEPEPTRLGMRDTIDMAREVKMPYDFVTGEPIYIEKLKAFEALVRADEQEKYKWDIHSCGPTCKRYACVAMREAVEAEREACAKVCDSRAMEYDGFSAEQNASEKLAAAIRARGNT
jgi:hypothetical protein